MESEPIVPLPVTQVEYHRLIRSRIEHEDQLMASRLSYFVASQSFLLLSYAMTVNGPARAANEDWYATQARLLLVCIPLLSIATCLVIYVSILGAIQAQHQLRTLARERISVEAQEALPPIQTARYVRLLGHGVPILIPLLFLAVWIWLLLAGGGYPPPRHMALPDGASRVATENDHAPGCARLKSGDNHPSNQPTELRRRT